MIGSDHEAHGVRNDHPDESDHAADGHHGPGQQRRHQKDHPFGAFGINAQRPCRLFTQGQNVQHPHLLEEQEEPANK